MARPLLVPTAFLTLVGLCPACFDEARANPTGPAEASEAVQPEDVVAVATTRSGNARTPSYDSAMINRKGGPNATAGVVLVADPPAPAADVPAPSEAPAPAAATTVPAPTSPAHPPPAAPAAAPR